MPFIPVFLATDVLLWLLIWVLAAYGVYCSLEPHLALPWKRVFRAKAAVICSVMLAFFLTIGLLDSFHFRARLESQAGVTAYSPEVLSVLDLALVRLREQRERTYSAPLATRLYAKELVEAKEGPDAGKQ